MTKLREWQTTPSVEVAKYLFRNPTSQQIWRNVFLEERTEALINERAQRIRERIAEMDRNEL